MRAPSLHRRGSVGANMTPMIDVVFLLIIFFLVSSHLARQETRLPLDLPTASTSGPLDLERSALTISVDENADWRVSGGVVDAERVREVLRDHVVREGDSAAVRMRTDRSIQYRFVEPLLQEIARAGIVDVTISVRRQETR